MTRPVIDCLTCSTRGHDAHGQPCPTCNGNGLLDRDRTVIWIGRLHGTTVAADWCGIHPNTAATIRKRHDGYVRGRGHPTIEEMAAARPDPACPCPRCTDLRVTADRARRRRRAHLAAKAAAAVDPSDRTWHHDANCIGVDPDLFFPGQGEATRPAKKICAACTVRDQCLEYALSNGFRFGIFGGTSERERRRMRRRQGGAA